MKDRNQNKKLRKKRYYWEILVVSFGIWMLYSGIVVEMRHEIGLSYNSKGLKSVTTGLMITLYGVLLIIGGVVSAYNKLKKNNEGEKS